MPLYDHDDRTITETDTSSGWLPGLSLGALKLAFSASGDGWGGHPGDVSVSLMKSPCIHIYLIQSLNTLRPRQDGCLFADDILKCIFLNLNSRIPNTISWKYVAWRLIDNKPSMVQIMGCRRAGDKPIIWTIDGIYCETRPRWPRRSSWRHKRFSHYIAIVFVFTVYCVLWTSLLLWIYVPIYSYHCPYKHYLLPMCFEMPLYLTIVYFVYSFIYVLKVGD